MKLRQTIFGTMPHDHHPAPRTPAQDVGVHAHCSAALASPALKSGQLHIVFVADHLRAGGAERHMVALAAGLAVRGHRVTVAYLKASDDLAAQLNQAQIRCLCCSSSGGLDRAALARLKALLTVERPKLLVATSQYSLMFAALARLPTPRQPVLAFICHSTQVVRRGWRAWLRFIIYRQFYRLAHCVVFVSEQQRSYYAALGVSIKRSEVVHNGIDLYHFAAARDGNRRGQLRQALGFTSTDLVLGLCALFREEKRHADLLSAVAQLRALGLPFKILLVGDGPERRNIEAFRDRLGLQDAIVLAGFQHDVRPFIEACDAMVLTSHSETFPLATLEYMAMGKPIVASRVGGIGEQLSHGVNGLLYGAGEVGALVAALRQLSDARLREQLGQGALATVRARFDLHTMLASYETLLLELQHGPNASASTP